MSDKWEGLRKALEAVQAAMDITPPGVHYETAPRLSGAVATASKELAAVSDPATVLALLAERDRLAAQVSEMNADGEALLKEIRGPREDIERSQAAMVAENVRLRAELAEARRDAERLDWIEAAARRQKIEIARSILGVGFEIGEWPNMRVTVRNGSLRAAIDSAMGRAE